MLRDRGRVLVVSGLDGGVGAWFRISVRAFMGVVGFMVGRIMGLFVDRAIRVLC